MILPILIYNNSFLRKKCKKIDKSFTDLNKIIKNMFETMYNARGVGLAANQIGYNIRVFIIKNKIFINPKLIKTYGDLNKNKEGCLSIPSVFENVLRKSNIKIKYFNENWKLCIDKFNGINARIIQHEYDHIDGKLFIDRISPFKMDLISNKLKILIKGKINVNYPIKINN